MKAKYRIFIVDDHRIFREGLAFLISHMSNYDLAGEASDGEEFLTMVGTADADIVLMDIIMPKMDGIEATARALEMVPGLKIVALTMFCEKEYLKKMISAGASGFLLKDSGKDEMEKALAAVISGETYYSQKVLNNVILRSGNNNSTGYSRIQDVMLTNIESNILKMICQGLSTSQISGKLSMSFRTIENHKADLMNKTGARNVINLAVFAVKNHLVEI